MREVVVSAATLAGLVGLACLYGNGKGIERSRVARATEFSAMNDALDYDELDSADGGMQSELNEVDLGKSDYAFAELMGYLDGSEDVPEDLAEDIRMFQGGQRKAVQFVAKCMRSPSCKENAVKKVKNWATEQWNELKAEDNRRLFMKPFVREMLPIITPSYNWKNEIKDEFRLETDRSIKQAYAEALAFEACTPYDNMLWRCPPNFDKTGKHQYKNPSGDERDWRPEVWTKNDEVLNLFEHERKTSQYLNEFTGAISRDERADYQKNAFGMFEKGVKIIYIIPNGIPIFMHEEVIINKQDRQRGKESQFRNYWDWFVHFNDRFLGIKKGINVQNRGNTGWWFIRQDENPLPYTKSIVKASKRFPWSRFETRLVVPQFTAVAPKIGQTYRLIAEAMAQKTTREMYIPSDYSRGNDCFVFWFHQYIPTDIFQLARPENQQRILDIEQECTVIHIWVGMDNKLSVDFGASTRVIKYVQKILQPTLLEKEHKDNKLNGYFYISSLAGLKVHPADDSVTYLGEGENLLQKVYNIVSMVKARVRCLLAVAPINAMTELDAYHAANARQNDYFDDIEFIFDDFNHVTSEGVVTTLEPMVSIASDFDAATATPGWNPTTTLDPNSNDTDLWYTTEKIVLQDPIYACCGVATNAVKYDTNIEQCCPSGARIPIDSYCV
jgi:hypothetical protein